MLSTRPSATIIRARTIDPSLRKHTSTKPRTTSAAYSAGPNFSASPDMTGPSSESARIATVPAMNDPNAEMPSATPAWPRRAIW